MNQPTPTPKESDYEFADRLHDIAYSYFPAFIGDQSEAQIERMEREITATTAPLRARVAELEGTLADLYEGRSVVLPKTKKHAHEMILVAEACAGIREERQNLAAQLAAKDAELARAIVGKLIIAGDMVVNDVPLKGLFIEMTEEALRAVKHLPMYENVVVVSLPASGGASKSFEEVYAVQSQAIERLHAELERLRAALETCKKSSCTRYDRFGYGYDSWEQVFDEAKVAAALTNPTSHEPTN